jgi:hypothetical protein
MGLPTPGGDFAQALASLKMARDLLTLRNEMWLLNPALPTLG